ncbi:MAG: hypothetical protein ACLTXH_06215 [Enterobacter hormaechei]
MRILNAGANDIMDEQEAQALTAPTPRCVMSCTIWPTGTAGPCGAGLFHR